MCRYADDFVCAFRYREDAQRFYRVLPKRLEKFSLEVATEKTQLLRFSRFHLGMQGIARVMRRTARKKLQGACRRIKDWIRKGRCLAGREFIAGLNNVLTLQRYSAILCASEVY